MPNQAEANLSALIESTEDLIWSVDLDFRLTSFNRAFQQAFKTNFGIDVEHGMRRDALLPQGESAFFPPLYQRALEEGPFCSDCILADGRTLELHFNPILADGQPAGVSVFGKDVAERKRMEEALRESEERYRASFEQAAVGIAHVSLEGRYLRCNTRFAEIVGYPQQEVLGLTCQQISSPDDLEFTHELNRQIEKKDFQAFTAEKRYIRKDGSLIWARVSLSPLRDAQGRIVYLICIVEDIQSRKIAEERFLATAEALRISEEHYRTIFQISQDCISVTHEKNGRIVDVNQEFLRVSGYEREEVIGRTTVELNIWTDPEDRLRLVASLRGGSAVRDIEFQLRKKNGELFWIQGSGARIELNGIPCFLIAFRDVTGARASAEALRASEERYRATFETNLDAIDICRLEDGMFIDVNDAYLRDTGFTRDEVIGHTSLEIGVWANSADRQKMVDEIRRNGACQNLEIKYRTRNGALRWGMQSVSQIEMGGVPCILAVTRDITDARAAAERLAATAEALQASEERYRTAFQTSIDAIAIARMKDGVFLDVNEAFLRMFGFKRDEVIDHNAGELAIWTDPNDRERLIEAMREKSACRDVEFQFRKKSGRRLWALVSGSRMEMCGLPCNLYVIRDVSSARAAAEALRASEERYRTAFETGIDAISISRLDDGIYIDCNPAFLSILGYQRDEVIGRTGLELGLWVNPGDRQALIEILRLNGGASGHEIQFRKKNGEILWGAISSSKMEINDVPCVLSITRDITDARTAAERLAAAQDALRLSEERYRTAFHTSTDAININRIEDGKYVDCNEAFLAILGYKREEVIGKTSLELEIWVNCGDREVMAKKVHESGSLQSTEFQFRKKNGEVMWGEMSASKMEVDGVSCVLSITRDISAAKAAQEKIRNLVFYDALTGLANRRQLTERLRQALAAGSRRHRSQALLFIDLDNFKNLNDTLGHQIGDLLLQEVAHRLVASVREADIVCRLGGDEFIVLLEDLSEAAGEAAAQARMVGEKILIEIAQPYLLDGHECHSTASIGVAISGEHAENSNVFLQQADIAMYQAKAAGRHTLRFFSPSVQAAVNTRSIVENELRQGIRARQFQLYYQPQFDRGLLAGVEALIRWHHPLRGLVLPDQFIALAEESSLALHLGDWALETACAQLASWAGRKETADLSVAVNISTLRFRQPEFVHNVLEALDNTGANPERLQLEITESVLVDNVEEAIAKMTELKSHGMSFSLDDFGTGYSSLSYLKRLPIDHLKIDCSFIHDMLGNATSGAIIQAIISLGRAMGLSVIAEGVETEEQLSFLANLGCHSYQGFLFSRPLPIEQLEAFLQDSRYCRDRR